MLRSARGLIAAIALGGGLAGTAPALGAAPHRPAPATHEQPVVVDAAGSSVDYEKGTAAFKGIVVSQGGTRVTAERAQVTGLDFESSRWTFAGHVIVTLAPSGTLRADHAIVEIRNNRVTRASTTGNPAEFEQQRAGSRPALHGHARQIVFDAVTQTVRLTGEASLSDGRNEITGPVLVYGLRGEKVTAVSPGQRRDVHIMIVPPARAGKRAAHGSGSRSRN